MNLEKYRKKETENYLFFVLPNSLAETDIDKITDFQEKCFLKVCDILELKSSLKINCIFFNDPESCGRSYNINAEPDEKLCINAFCYTPNFIHATYNKKIKAIGHHEIAHLLLFEKLKGRTPNLILNEGFAVFCDDQL